MILVTGLQLKQLQRRSMKNSPTVFGPFCLLTLVSYLALFLELWRHFSLSLLPNHFLTTEAWNCISTRGKTCEPWYFVPNRHIIIFPVCTVFFFYDCCRVWKEKWYEVWYCRMSYLRQITNVRQNRESAYVMWRETHICAGMLSKEMIVF